MIHTTNENVSCDLKEIFHYELWQKNVWYHTKFRPNCQRFLEEISKIYELHMVTFGERSYAHKIANLMDPNKKYFHDRILSRNEIFNPISKTDNLKLVSISFTQFFICIQTWHKRLQISKKLI